MQKVIIIDDEVAGRTLIRQYLDAYPTLIVVGEANNGVDAVRLINEFKPDLIFLDIQMPGASGFDLLKALSSINFEVIFITAFDHYGIQAIKFSALDYLLKPINITEFKEAIAKAKEKIDNKKKNHNIDNLLDYIKAGKKDSPKIALPTLNEIMYIKVSTIIRCEADNNYTSFFLDNGEQILVCKTLKDFAELLQPHDFVRTHQSHLVNLQFVKSYLKEDGGMLLLTNQNKIPISRQNKDKIRDELNKSL